MAYLRSDISTLDSSQLLGEPAVKPHIIPDVLYPSYVASGTSNKLLDGSTSHSGAFGTVQSDDRMYYYTNIAGSRKIKDPRIGAHFGSQRHRATSLQLLEQETGLHGVNVYSIDGRNWFRAVNGTDTSGSGPNIALVKWEVRNDNGGNYILVADAPTDSFIEIVGYFNDFNMLVNTGTDGIDDIDVKVNGAVSQDTNTLIGGRAAIYTPLGSRFISKHSVVNVGSTISASLGTTPAINTLKIEATNAGGEYFVLSGIELIAQDTTSTANKSKIQIPSQNVVSSGRKFIVSGTPHYDPFNGFTNSTSLHSAYVDTATSLGLSTPIATHGAPWAISGSNNIRPYNGGRVVKWVDSSGVINTSVNMMPPNAQNISTTAAAEITTPSATNVYLPAFSNDAVDHSLAEVAKSIHWREFGNGAANGNATYADASNLATSADDISYVMDDGLTSINAESVRIWPNISGDVTLGGDKTAYFTFIGTGLTLDNTSIGTYANAIDNGTYAQNLPYGTHTFEYTRNDSSGDTIKIDGVLVHTDTSTNGYLGLKYWNIHQPKMPPIPEDAVVIADYMLMADFVVTTAWSQKHISKGVRRVDCTRDVFYDSSGGARAIQQMSSADNIDSINGTRIPQGDTGAVTELPAFCTNQIQYGYNTEGRYQTWSHNASGSYATAETTKVGTSSASFYYPTTSTTLGLVKHKTHGAAEASSAYLEAIDVVSPIHTSSHYQTFETPYLHELVGGDRNMEQTNLVVTGDGKTWDEVTRDTSYIGNLVLQAQESTDFSEGSAVVFTDWRGLILGEDMVQKDFAHASDRQVCLKAGSYNIVVTSLSNAVNHSTAHIHVNGTLVAKGYVGGSGFTQTHVSCIMQLNRGDYVQIIGSYAGSAAGGRGNSYIIIRQPDLKSIKDNEPTQSAHAQHLPKNRVGRIYQRN